MAYRKKQSRKSPISQSVTLCKGVGPTTASLLGNLRILTIEDLLLHVPRSYLDRRRIATIASVEPSGAAVIQGQITRIQTFRPSRRLKITKCVITDATASLEAVWFNQPYLSKTLCKGATAIFSGTVSSNRGLQLINPDIEPVDEETRPLHTLGLIPVYPLTEGVGQKKLRRLMRDALSDWFDQIEENLPAWIRKKWRLLPRNEALKALHFPQNPAEATRARERLAFEEFLRLQLVIQSEASSESDKGVAHDAPPTLTRDFESRLSFRLTDAQRRTLATVIRKMEAPRKMNVLLQGDVGSGKTVVAAYSMLKALENQRQAVLMAPTEILAEQHFRSLHQLLGEMNLRIALLCGSLPPQEKRRTLARLASGEPLIVVGTHALIEEKVSIPNASLIIIDEQHRFGVNQRAALGRKGLNPDLVVMTATPIPRTLALTLYGGFDMLVIDQLPAGRRPIVTRHVDESNRGKMYDFVRDQLADGKQAFVVCPEIGDKATKRDASLSSLKQAIAEYRRNFPESRIELLHGRMSMEEREQAFSRFRHHASDILIATSIIEVGVDVPNATVMIIENADRFGVAQLHQLRGRVGRSHYKSYCFLMGAPSTPEAIKRIEIMTSTHDGFEIAEQDMLLRGPGEFLGTAQSGLPSLRVGHLIRDARLMDRARETASEVLASDPSIDAPENQPLRALVTPCAWDAVNL
ncbi:MAG: ATP-dependent DNA helicase RecG [Candidatus Abyssubacteria bacterium]